MLEVEATGRLGEEAIMSLRPKKTPVDNIAKKPSEIRYDMVQYDK